MARVFTKSQNLMLVDFIAGWSDSSLLLLAALVVMIGGFLRGFIGFGGSLIIIPVLAEIFTPREAVALHLIMEVPGTMQLLPVAWRDCEPRVSMPAIIAMVIGTPVGAYLLATLDPDLMRIAIALVVLSIVTLLAMDWQLPFIIGPKVMTAVGTIAGFAQGSTGMGMPPLVVTIVSRGDTPDKTRGNVLATAAGMIAVAVPVQLYFGNLSYDAVIVGLTAGLIYVIATFTGSKFYEVGGEKIYRHAVLFLLAGIAGYSLVTNLI